MTGEPIVSAAGEHLREAAAWRLLGLLLERPRGGWRAEVDSLAAELASEDLRAAARKARDDEAIYLALLGPGGPASPREVAYRGRHDPGAILADLRGFYEAFAYRPGGEDPPDHVATEAGFVAYLHLKIAYARAAGEDTAAAIAADALERFLEAHLRYYAEPFAVKLRAVEDGAIAAAAAALAARVGPPLAAPVAEPDAGELTCGGVECSAFRTPPGASSPG